MAISVEEFSKALKSLEEVLLLPKNDVVRDATIQRFEFCVELAWKCAKKHMGTSSSAPKQVIREMAQNNLIVDIEAWLSALEARNLSSHTYDQDLAEKVYEEAKKFLPFGSALLKSLINTP